MALCEHLIVGSQNDTVETYDQKLYDKKSRLTCSVLHIFVLGFSRARQNCTLHLLLFPFLPIKPGQQPGQQSFQKSKKCQNSCTEECHFLSYVSTVNSQPLLLWWLINNLQVGRRSFREIFGPFPRL